MDDFTIVNKITLLTAKRNSGKSVLLKRLVEGEKNAFKKIYCVCPTESINYFYQKDGLVEPECIFESWSENWALRVIKQMTEHNSNKNHGDMKKILIILDDCIADVSFRTSETLKRLFVRSIN